MFSIVSQVGFEDRELIEIDDYLGALSWTMSYLIDQTMTRERIEMNKVGGGFYIVTISNFVREWVRIEDRSEKLVGG